MKILSKVLLLSLLLSTSVFAVEVPAVIVNLVSVIKTLIVDYFAVLLILIVLIMGAWRSQEVGNGTPFKWALFAALVIGAASFFGESLTDFASSAFNLTGTEATVDSNTTHL